MFMIDLILCLLFCDTIFFFCIYGVESDIALDFWGCTIYEIWFYLKRI